MAGFPYGQLYLRHQKRATSLLTVAAGKHAEASVSAQRQIYHALLGANAAAVAIKTNISLKVRNI